MNHDEIIKKTKKFCIETTFAYPLVVKSGFGCYIEDINDKLYLDFNSNVCSCAVGYNHPEIMEVIRSFVGVGAHKIAGQDFYTKEQVELAEELLRTVPKNLSRVLLINTGAEAVENAIKFAFRKKGPLPGVSCTNAFHGRTLGALTFTDSKAVQKKNYPEINHEVIKFCTKNNDPEVNSLEELIKREWIPAFMLVECIQGEGGYNVASKKFIKNLRKTSKKYGFPLIIDEIQSGIGRTGKWWSFEHFGIKPDIITSGKALQVGAVISSKEYDPKEPGAVSSTWGGGHRIDMAVGLKTIEIIKHEKLLDNATKVGNYMMKRLREIKKKHPIIVDVRGLGLMIGVEFSKEIYKDIIPKMAFKKGLLLIGCGKKAIRITPPLIITKEEADKGLDIFEDVIKHLRYH
jgi:4-aminobutyrate aminotransferase